MQQWVKRGPHSLVVRGSEEFSKHRVFIWEENGLMMTNTLKESLSKNVENNTTRTSENREKVFLTKIRKKFERKWAKLTFRIIRLFTVEDWTYLIYLNARLIEQYLYENCVAPLPSNITWPRRSTNLWRDANNYIMKCREQMTYYRSLL